MSDLDPWSGEAVLGKKQRRRLRAAQESRRILVAQGGPVGSLEVIRMATYIITGEWTELLPERDSTWQEDPT